MPNADITLLYEFDDMWDEDDPREWSDHDPDVIEAYCDLENPEQCESCM